MQGEDCNQRHTAQGGVRLLHERGADTLDATAVQVKNWLQRAPHARGALRPAGGRILADGPSAQIQLGLQETNDDH